MIRNWFNWFSKEAPRRPTARRRRRLGAGFEAIEPRLLMARAAVVFQIAPVDVDLVPGETVLVDVEIAPANRGGGNAPNVTVPADDFLSIPTRDTESNSAQDMGGFIDIGKDDPDYSGDGFGATYVDEGAAKGGGADESAVNTGPVNDQAELLITPVSDTRQDGADPSDLISIGTDPAGFDPLDPDLISPLPGGMAPTVPDPAGNDPFTPDPIFPDPFHPGEDFNPDGPGTSSEPAPASPFSEGFGGLSTRHADRLGPQLPDSRDEEGGAIDITPHGSQGREEDIVTLPSQQSGRTAAPQVEGASPQAAKEGAADVALRASRGESQAFELAMVNFRRDRVVAQRVAPPRPEENLSYADGMVAAADVTDDGEPQVDPPVEPPTDNHRTEENLPAVAAGSIVTQLGLWLGIETGLIKAMALACGAEKENAATTSDTCRGAHRSNLPADVTTVADALTDSRQQPMPHTDHDTAARMVGVGLIVIAGQAGAIYFQPDRSQAQRSTTRDWELDLEHDRS